MSIPFEVIKDAIGTVEIIQLVAKCLRDPNKSERIKQSCKLLGISVSESVHSSKRDGHPEKRDRQRLDASDTSDEPFRQQDAKGTIDDEDSDAKINEDDHEGNLV
ncbi:hypothetical protein CERZMDRAFT_99656 [Cercospora zeae-maydis SCOH1-5]|uniref:Uncharacterized protein n=1 Tax=Cercospora zeae-maydis SCOH1-5 TaxID=717836 RepID=A0A6A6FA16_9PEZI|nr:hypothetical protein CERZMDRAFT_99656 [Cercospora zeae-maydis SCOH1-5]